MTHKQLAKEDLGSL